MAAADADMRHDMNVEDEYFSVIEKRDTEIMLKDKQLTEENVQLQEKDTQLQEKDSLLRSSISMLLQAGVSIDDVAAKLNIDPETVHRMLT